MMDREQADRIEATLNSMLRVVAAQAVKGTPLTEAAQLLDRAGLDSRLIADACDATPGGVRSVLSTARGARASRGDGTRKGGGTK